jgi:hypothetical protein
MNTVGQLALTWLSSHQQLLQGVVLGWVASHPALLMRWAWQAAVKVPILRQALLSNPASTKAFAAALLAEFNKDVDEEVAKEQPASEPPAKQ